MPSKVEMLKDLKLHRDDLNDYLDPPASLKVRNTMLDRLMRTLGATIATSERGTRYTRKQSFELLLSTLKELDHA